MADMCPKPVISAVHGACIGGGMSLITAADIRYATKDAWFTLKEVDIGLTADVGALQRLPRIIGNQSLHADYNSAMMQGEDFLNAAMSQATKSPPPIFSKL
ncbi:delta(3,5)-Delta(2,4)-dienoyl-CoA isomerase, mitochondrial [Diaphorina citri]|uniref:Delta(3,5)-Delta(2,4)-dienoyl-CoA isomerase, mitochondrial n=1 Tax=Diaphorina citri TaxID=121845 RepID=A0A1S3DFG4_DIACI|nr:delta(3,5)-Delta(2,4)-dienoyl-CoA isomerase, mitochondrial [Diaphorina citri]